jgi:hypothetical protein
MKKLIFTSILGLALVAFTGCTTSDNANVGEKCSASGKCDSAKKVAKKVAKKCTSSKCSSGKCGK